MHKQWLLELMGQIRLFLRSAPKIRSEDCAKKADSNTASGFHLLFDILAIGALCLSETETLLSQDIASLTSSGWRNRLESLPLRYAPWMHCTVHCSILSPNYLKSYNKPDRSVPITGKACECEASVAAAHFLG